MPFSSVSVSDFIGYLFFRTIVTWARQFRKVYECFRSSLRNQFHGSPSFDEKSCATKVCSGEGQKLIIKDDVELVMKRLGLLREEDGGCFGENFVESDEITELFDDREPTFEELHEAFCVFDEDGDGFIDPEDLQRVLCNLGFKEGSQVEHCERMIRIHDENGDGRIDLEEFLQFMQSCPF